jgi:signal transduction histidine kinase
VTVLKDFSEVPLVCTDRHQVLQILVNLIRNAKDALDDAGTPEKELRIKLEATSEACVRVDVRDNGIGIPPENFPLLFRHGFTTRARGHGFGLHSAAMLAQELGGSLTAASEGWGRGSVFTLELPLEMKDKSPAS